MNAPWIAERERFFVLLEAFDSVSVLSHIRPDADAIGTSLGVAHILRELGKRVEVLNASEDLPRHLDFLPGFGRIKHRPDFDRSLIVSCDCGSVDRLGFDLQGRTIVNFDHHVSNTRFGTLNVVDPEAASSSEVAYRFFRDIAPVTPEAAECFYAALISDTRHFTTSTVTLETFRIAQELIAIGVDPARVAQMMLQRRSLASLRILGRALESLRLYRDARVATMLVTREDLEATGAKMSDLDGLVDYARSLVTVEVAVFVVQTPTGYKVSLRSKGADLLPIARRFGGGGHPEAAGFDLTGGEDPERVIETILETIDETEVLSNNG
ncbi:DHH family phosphoesterase [Nitratifractor sp.]